MSVTFFGWHPCLFSRLLIAVLESELESRLSWLASFVFLGNTVVTSLATSTAIACGLLLSNYFRGPWWCGRTIYGVVYGDPSPSLSESTSLSCPLIKTSCRRVHAAVLRYRWLRMISGGNSRSLVLWPSFGWHVWFLSKGRGLIRLSSVNENKINFQWDYGTLLQLVARILRKKAIAGLQEFAGILL